MKFPIIAAAALAAASFCQPAQAATVVEIEAWATGTTESLLCMTGPQCATTESFSAMFSRTVTLGDFVDGAAFFQSGPNANAGILSGTVLDMGGGLMKGIDFRFGQTRTCSVPCMNMSTSATAATFSVRALFPSASTGATASTFSTGALLSSTSAVPEPGTWATMLIGFGAIGGAMRRAARTRFPALV